MRQLPILLFFIFCNSFAQQVSQDSTFNYLILEGEGDLNGDKLKDKVTIFQDTINEYRPYKLEIFFRKPNGQLELMASSTKFIEAEYPDGRPEWQTQSHVAEAV